MFKKYIKLKYYVTKLVIQTENLSVYFEELSTTKSIPSSAYDQLNYEGIKNVRDRL